MTIFFEIGIILLFAAIGAYIAKSLKQPPILAYIIIGVILGPMGLKAVGSQENIEALASIGVAFLLFIVGLELNYAKLKKLGITVICIALFQIIVTAILAFLLVKGFFAGQILSIVYLTLALTFGSTIVVVKLLSEKKLTEHLFGKISLGILLIQDIFVIIAIVFLENYSHSTTSDLAYITASTVGKTLLIFLAIWGIGHYIVNYFLKKTARYPEILFIVAIAWCFLGAMFANFIGLSIEVGAFLAGVSIASTAYTLEISSRIKPLRDFFIIMFFVILGLQSNFSALSQWPLVLLFSLFVIIVHPLTVMIIMALFGFRKRTSFLTAISITQISEFALLIAILGLKLGHITPEIESLIMLVAIITMFISTYLIIHQNKIYSYIRTYLKIFERKNIKWEDSIKKMRLSYDHTILVGARRTGFSILKTLKALKKEIVVVEVNPDLAEELTDKKIPVVYGDITDPEIIDNLNIREANMFISTVPEYEDNLMIVQHIRKHNHKIIIYVTAHNALEALTLYKFGADYVLLPHYISGEHMSNLLKEVKDDEKNIKKRKNTQIHKLEKHLTHHGAEH